MKKTIFLGILLIFITLALSARELTVESFEADPSDLSARTNAVNDLNGNKCALIRVSLPNGGGEFQGNVLKQDYHINEYLVYISMGSKHLQLLYPGMETLKIDLASFNGGQGVESGVTYRLRLSGYDEIPFTSTVTNQTANNNITNGHEAVDLGLSVKWATCNVGAAKPSDYGNYYAWGETDPKSTYAEGNSVTYGKSMNDIGGTKYDVAHTDWGAGWRIPTKAEFKELIDKCKWRWTTLDGHAGYKVTGPTGNSIFLPAAGYRLGDSASYEGSHGYYWTSTPGSYDGRAWSLYFTDNDQDIDWNYRFNGRPIRPVTE